MEGWGKFVDGRPSPEPSLEQRCWVQFHRDDGNQVLALATYHGKGLFGSWAWWIAEEAYEDARFHRIAWRPHDPGAAPPVFFAPAPAKPNRPAEAAAGAPEAPALRRAAAS